MLSYLRCLLGFCCLLMLSSCATKHVPSYLTAGLMDFSAPEIESSAMGYSKILLLSENEDALHAILTLADSAKSHIEVQYYLFFKDKTGLMVRERLMRAANRGVKVRLLVDDMGLLAVKDEIRLLNAHPNIEVRLFNPLGGKWLGPARWLDWIGSPMQINRRMHNKLFAVDGKWIVTGGRNVGDHYFKSSAEAYFKDLDVMAQGALAKEASIMFERYWSCQVAVPVENYLTGIRRYGDKSELSLWQDEILSDSEVQRYLSVYERSGWKSKFKRGQLPWIQSRSKLIYDEPDKILKIANQSEHLLMGAELTHLADTSKEEVIIVSPYFVPADEGVKFLKSLCDRNVRVVLLTNSLASTDVALVHGGYLRYRDELLDAGVEIYEFKPDAKLKKGWKRKNPSSRASLHAKTFIFDGKTVFVGSFNVDPRSANLNTEMGVLAHNPTLATEVRSLVLEATQLTASYKLQRNAKGRVTWVTLAEGKFKTYTSDPDCGWKRKLGSFCAFLLPIESQL